MSSATMVHKANQIALFFSSYPHDEAVVGVANHLRQFWEPRMRRQIVSYVAEGGTGLSELASEAVRTLEPVSP